MSDLIWVGNTLYPRWIVIVVPLIVTLMTVVSLRMIWDLLFNDGELW